MTIPVTGEPHAFELDDNSYPLLQLGGGKVKWDVQTVPGQPGDSMQVKSVPIEVHGGYGATHRIRRGDGTPSDPAHHAYAENVSAQHEGLLYPSPRITYLDIGTLVTRARSFRVGNYHNSIIGGSGENVGSVGGGSYNDTPQYMREFNDQMFVSAGRYTFTVDPDLTTPAVSAAHDHSAASRARSSDVFGNALGVALGPGHVAEWLVGAQTASVQIDGPPVDSGVISPSTGDNLAAVGTNDWTNPGNILTSNDVYATNATEGAARGLRALNFGFLIPTGSVIEGVLASVERKTSFAGGSLDTGADSPGTGASDSSVGSNAWTNPTNIVSSNNSYATNAIAGTSHALKATNFGFAIPLASTIVGIKAEIERKAASSGGSLDTGADSPGTGGNLASVGTNAWSSPSNLLSANDVYATNATEGLTQGLRASNFGFAIPAGAVIAGVVAEVQRKTSFAGGSVTSAATSPATGASDASVGTNAWTSPTNILSSNNSYATCATAGTTRALKATAFGFAIPTSATILGITAAIERKATTGAGSTDTGADSPGTGASDASVGTNAWTNPTNALSSDGAYATCAIAGTTRALKATNFGFAIPSTATILGIKVEIERKAAAGAGPATDTFNYTGASQDWTWPTGVTTATVDIEGAAGHANGARVQGTITKGGEASLRIEVGGNAGYNGGGAAGFYGTAGGGASDIRQGGTALANRVGVAGGGGGYGGDSGGTGGAGGAGGTTTGAAGANGNTGVVGGGGGTPSAGGAGGAGGGLGADGEAGSLGVGGGTGSPAPGGGGGGGGYYGGGEGEYGGAQGGGGGGGGSSYAGGLSAVTHTQGYRAGNGRVQITYTLPGISDERVSLVKADATFSTTDKGTATVWPTADAYATYGTGTTDLWGETWTPANINDVDFGVILQAIVDSGNTASVDHIRVTVYYSTTGIVDERVSIVKADGTFGATDKGTASVWPTSDAYATYGGAADLWGESWTPANINDADFGVFVQAIVDASNTASVDHIRITITYSVPVSIDSTIQLVGAAGTVIGANKSTGASWPTTEAYASFGGAADLWAATLTATDVNDSDFGFIVSADHKGAATLSIDHMRVTVYYSTSGMIDSRVSLVKADGTFGVTNKASASVWPTSDAYATYGTGTTDLWGESWTAANINDADFGVILQALIDAGNTASVDHIRVTVYYTVPVSVDATVQLVDDTGTVIGANKSAGAAWPTTEAYASFGGAADLWSAALTAEMVNDTDFGFIVAPTHNGNATLSVDHMRMTVYYHTVTVDQTQTGADDWQQAEVASDVYRTGVAGRLFSALANRVYNVLPGLDPLLSVNYLPSNGEVITDPKAPIRSLVEFSSALVAGTQQGARTLDPNRGYQGVPVTGDTRLSASEYDGRAMLSIGSVLFHATSRGVQMIEPGKPPRAVGPELLRHNDTPYKGLQWGVPDYLGDWMAWPAYMPASGNSVVFIARLRGDDDPGSAPVIWHDMLYLADRECRCVRLWGGSATRGARLFFGAGSSANPYQVGWCDLGADGGPDPFTSEGQPAESSFIETPLDDLGLPGVPKSVERVEIPFVHNADATNYLKVSAQGGHDGAMIDLVGAQGGSANITTEGFSRVFAQTGAQVMSEEIALRFTFTQAAGALAANWLMLHGTMMLYYSEVPDTVPVIVTIIDAQTEDIRVAEALAERVRAMVARGHVRQRFGPDGQVRYVKVTGAVSAAIEINDDTETRLGVQVTMREVMTN